VIVRLLKAATDPRLLGSIDWWPRQLELLGSLDGDERLHVWAIGRQAGKSSLAAAAAVHNVAMRDDLDAMVPRGRTRYALVACPAEDQAREFIRLCAALVDASPALRSLAIVKADRIDFSLPSGGRSAIRAMPANSRSVRGLSASLIVLDEFAHFSDTAGPSSDEAMYTALEPSTRVFRDAARVLVISTPFGETGKFHDLFTQASNGLLPSARAVHAPVWKVDTSLDEAWMDARRVELGEDVFRQELGAEFVAGGGQFFDLRGVDFEDAPAAPDDGEAWVAALDPAFHADAFGVALVGRSRWEPGLLVVGAVGSFKPAGSARSFEARRGREDETLARVWELVEPYRPSRVVSDQHNSVAIESYFGRKGVPVEIVNLTRAAQTSAFVSLRARLIDGSLSCWREPQLIEELRRVRSARNSEAIDLPRFGGSHCDAAAALALGVRSVDETGGPLVAVKIVPSGASRSPIPSQARYSDSPFG
jgi:hypothetical protein